MNAFVAASEVEAQSMRRLIPWLKEARAYDGQLVKTAKGRLSKELQKQYGDVFLNDKQERIVALEMKAEKFQRETENLFLEEWSNRTRYTPGWMVTLQADVLLYHFLDGHMGERLYTVPLNDLKGWAFVRTGTNGYPGRLYDYPARPQGAYDQLNDTWGRIVPISVLMNEAGLLDITHVFHKYAKASLGSEQTSYGGLFQHSQL